MPTLVPSNIRLPRHPFGKYALVPRDPWMTDPYFGPMFGAKIAFVPSSVVSRSKPSTVRAVRIQPHPYTFEEHPVHAARAKWLEEYEKRKLYKEKSGDLVDSKPRKLTGEVNPLLDRFAAPGPISSCITN